MAARVPSRVTPPLISRGNLKKDALMGEVALVTGAGRGIGYEASKALLWLGATVVIAEIDATNCTKACEALRLEFGDGRIIGLNADIGNEENVSNVARVASEKFGRVDIVLNNATSLEIGAVREAKMDAWDKGYHIILRGPVLLARAFLPSMVARKHGVFVCVSSSGAAPYMGPYEVFKTAQVELANTIAGEVEGTGVYAYTIGPGIVRTPGFMEGGSKVAALMGISTDELIAMNRSALLTVEEAGTGFAASIARAAKYHGSEISSIQVLRDIGISLVRDEEVKTPRDGSQVTRSCSQMSPEPARSSPRVEGEEPLPEAVDLQGLQEADWDVGRRDARRTREHCELAEGRTNLERPSREPQQARLLLQASTRTITGIREGPEETRGEHEGNPKLDR